MEEKLSSNATYMTFNYALLTHFVPTFCLKVYLTWKGSELHRDHQITIIITTGM